MSNNTITVKTLVELAAEAMQMDLNNIQDQIEVAKEISFQLSSPAPNKTIGCPTKHEGLFYPSIEQWDAWTVELQTIFKTKDRWASMGDHPTLKTSNWGNLSEAQKNIARAMGDVSAAMTTEELEDMRMWLCIPEGNFQQAMNDVITFGWWPQGYPTEDLLYASKVWHHLSNKI